MNGATEEVTGGEAGRPLIPRFTTAERAEVEHNASTLGISPPEFMRRRTFGYRLPDRRRRAAGAGLRWRGASTGWPSTSTRSPTTPQPRRPSRPRSNASCKP